jgi:hypothetical protein
MATPPDGKPGPQAVRLTVRPLPDDAPAAVRLRRWLKLGLRTFGLKCLSVEEVPNGSPGTAPAALEAAKADSGAAGVP